MDVAGWVAAGAGVLLLVFVGILIARHGRRTSSRAAPAARGSAYVNLRRVFAEQQASAAVAAPAAEAPRSAPARPSEPDGLTSPLRDPDPFVRIGAIAALGEGPEAEGTAIDALRDEFPLVRREAVRALTRMGGRRVASALSDVVQHDPSAEVREEAVAALATMIEHRRAEDGPAS